MKLMVNPATFVWTNTNTNTNTKLKLGTKPLQKQKLFEDDLIRKSKYMQITIVLYIVNPSRWPATTICCLTLILKVKVYSAMARPIL